MENIAEQVTQLKTDFDEVHEAGKKAEYDEFWDNFQINGNRGNYLCGFAGSGWTSENFRPKYSMDITYAYMMFRNNACSKSLPDICTEQNIFMKFDKSTDLTQTFFSAKFPVIGEVSALNVSTLNATFHGAECHTIKKLKVKGDGTQTYTNAFTNANNLATIEEIEGVIGRTFQIHYSPLTVDSMKSIISCLKKYETTDSGYMTYTVKFSENCWANLEATTPPEGYNSWKNYVAELGWNV